MTAGSSAGTPHQPPRQPVSTVDDLLSGAVEKQLHHRRTGKYTHPYGGMRQFAEDRAANSGWDHDCLSFENLESRKVARSNVAEKISEIYKEEFVRVNKLEGKGRPKANNISAAKKTVRMIAERILLSLEAKATQHLFNEVVDKGKESEKELSTLRRILKCGKENPKLPFDEVRAMASATQNSTGERSVNTEADNATSPRDSNNVELADEGDPEVEVMKQALIEMRADQVAKGYNLKPLNPNWARQVTAASNKLVRESFSRQLVPKTKVHGCRHFTRKNRVLMVCCGTFTVCRMCHIQDPNRVHEVRIEPVHTMLCMMCGEVQPKTQVCRKCEVCFGSYYCDVCGITDDTPGYDLRHCPDCNVCMPGLTFHCNRCKSCVPATPGHEAVCTGASPEAVAQLPSAAAGASPMSAATGGAHGANVTVGSSENLDGQNEQVDQSMEPLATVDSRQGHMFSGL